MKSLLDMSANVIFTVHCQNNSEILCIISRNTSEITLCYNLCTKVCTDVYSSLKTCAWITLSLGLHISRRHVSVNVFVLASETDYSEMMHVLKKQKYVKALHLWTH